MSKPKIEKKMPNTDWEPKKPKTASTETEEMMAKKNEIAWLSDDPVRPLRSTPIDELVPMPDFASRKNTEFENIGTEKPALIDDDWQSRLNIGLKGWRIENPAFKTALTVLTNTNRADLTLMEWEWHRRALREARKEDSINRVYKRAEFENILARMEIQRQLLVLDKIRKFYFDRAYENALRSAKDKLEVRKDYYEHEEDRFVQNKLIADERKWEQMLRIYLIEETPTKAHYDRLVEEYRHKPSIAEVLIAEDKEITPFERVLEIAERMFPLVQRDELAAKMTRIQNHLDEVDIAFANSAVYKNMITNLFIRVFGIAFIKKTRATKDESVRYDALLRDRKINLDKKVDSLNRDKDRAEQWAGELAEERKYADQIAARKAYFASQLERRDEYADYQRDYIADMFKATPLTIEGVTIQVMKHPARRLTQIGVVKEFHNAIDMLKKRRETGDLIDEKKDFEKRDDIGENAKAMAFARAADVEKLLGYIQYRTHLENILMDTMNRLYATHAAIISAKPAFVNNTSLDLASDPPEHSTQRVVNVSPVREPKRVIA